MCLGRGRGRAARIVGVLPQLRTMTRMFALDLLPAHDISEYERAMTRHARLTQRLLNGSRQTDRATEKSYISYTHTIFVIPAEFHGSNRNASQYCFVHYGHAITAVQVNSNSFELNLTQQE